MDHKKLRPFEITEVKGPVNYRLKLPKLIRIHLVFHISLLKKALLGALLVLKTEVQQLDLQKEYKVKTILDC